MSRNPRGSIAIFSRRGRLYLQFPRRWFGGEQKYHALELSDTPENRLWAQERIAQMHLDYLRGSFDPSLAAYFVSEVEPSADLTLAQLWAEYCQYKAQSLKAASIRYLVKGLGNHIAECPYQAISEALEVRKWLFDRTTPDMSRRAIAALATAVKWGIKHGKVTDNLNPFAGMAEDIRVEKDDPHPNGFTEEEQERIITAFEGSKYYYHYAPLVKFWFMTGCRPSEGIGLEWSQISSDYSKIKFDRSIVCVDGKTTKSKKSKTNRTRTFPTSDRLQKLLIDLNSQNDQDNPLVFPGKSGKPINYVNFCHRAWDEVVDPIIDRPTTPYSCRDTFISQQIAKGIPIAVIARWCDNSVKMIEKYYFDPSAIDNLKPL